MIFLKKTSLNIIHNRCFFKHFPELKLRKRQTSRAVMALQSRYSPGTAICFDFGTQKVF